MAKRFEEEGFAGIYCPSMGDGLGLCEALALATRTIPLGTTISYGELAKRIGRPTASRAVARANGDNYLAILIPCHRVIGSDGSPTGYGGGIWRKLWLLDHERKMTGTMESLFAPRALN